LLYEKKFLWYLKRVDYDMRLCIRCIPVELMPDFKLFLLNHLRLSYTVCILVSLHLGRSLLALIMC